MLAHVIKHNEGKDKRGTYKVRKFILLQATAEES